MDTMVFPTGMMDIDHPGQYIMDMTGAGFTELVLDLSLCCTPYELENEGKKIESVGKDVHKSSAVNNPGAIYERLQPMLAHCATAGIHYSTAIAPYLCRDTKRRDLNGLLIRLAEESIRVCGRTGCRYLVIRPLSDGGPDMDDLGAANSDTPDASTHNFPHPTSPSSPWDLNRQFYLHLLPLAREHGVMLLLANQCKNINGHLTRGVCSDGREAAEWVDRLNEEAGEQRFGFCMDVGVCSLCGQNMYDFTLTLGDRLKAVILRDCDGNQDSAMLPFTCVGGDQSRTDWLSLIRGLRKIGFSGKLMLNMADTAAAFSPILRPELLRLAKSTAEYFSWQIGIEGLLKKYPSRVLFGAGNMCRNYMKCYGEQYPPLYTCDNNSKLWGTLFCGLEVKPPEQLRRLPEDCAVFICNIYYREIEKQLRDMGIGNPIEFFNDEYMPSFYFDRLEEGGRR